MEEEPSIICFKCGSKNSLLFSIQCVDSIQWKCTKCGCIGENKKIKEDDELFTLEDYEKD